MTQYLLVLPDGSELSAGTPGPWDMAAEVEAVDG